MRIALFEDRLSGQFAPIAWLRPVFELVCGRWSLRERLCRVLPIASWGVFVRPFLAETYHEEQPYAAVNNLDWLSAEPTLLINGRWLPDADALRRLQQSDNDDAGIIDQSVAWIRLHPDEVPLLTLEDWDDQLAAIARTRTLVSASGRLAARPWDLVLHNGSQLAIDFSLRRFGESRGKRPRGPMLLGGQVAIVGDSSLVDVDPEAQLDPFVVLDARHGPITIDPGVIVQPFTRIEGPCHVARGAQLFRANVRGGTTIGPLCRVGGEVEASILHGCVNKYHDGFLGHSYICPWVNLGALTTNSDLKNDYSHVSVPLEGIPLDTGSQKVGSFIGDHTKTALSTLFNTGSSIGVMCMLLPGGELLPKHVPSFCRVWHGVLDDNLNFEASLKTARAVLERRHHELTPAQERLLRFVHQATFPERQNALRRVGEKRALVRSA